LIARTDLTGTASRHRTIAAIARSWGFTSPSHFATRFRAAYGISPRDYQHHADAEKFIRRPATPP
jgi:AraC-like DNA-binding protein